MSALVEAPLSRGKKSSSALAAAVLGELGGVEEEEERAVYLDDRISDAIKHLDNCSEFLEWLAHFGFEGTAQRHYREVLSKLLQWIENPVPPSSHKSVIEHLGGVGDAQLGLLGHIFWTPFLECFFLEVFHQQFFRKRSRDLEAEEEELIEMTCRLIKYLCRYGRHGEVYHNVVQAGAFGACQFLARVLRFYRDREGIVTEALKAVLNLTMSKSNPADKEDKNLNAVILDQVSDASICEVLFKVMAHWRSASPAIVELTCRAVQSVAQCSLTVRKNFGRAVGGDACGELFRTLRLYRCQQPAKTTDATTSSHQQAYASVCAQTLRAMSTLCDTDQPAGSSSDSRSSSSSTSRRDAARDALWRFETDKDKHRGELCSTVLEAMWNWGIVDAQVVEFGFRAITMLVHRDDDSGPRRHAFGHSSFTSRSGPFEQEIGICDVFLRAVSRWLEHTGPTHCVEEGVKCLTHLTYKGHPANTAAFEGFFKDSELDLTEVRLEKKRALHALEHKLRADVEHYEAKGKKTKAKFARDNFPQFLLPKA